MRLTIGAILAGGQSTRMGTDKSSLQLDGRSFLDRARDLLWGVCDEVVVVGGVDPDIKDGGDGPLLAVNALLASGRGSRYLVIPVDQPRLTADVLQALLDADGQRSDDPSLGGLCFADEPLPLVVRACAGPAITAHIAAGQRRLSLASSSSIPLPEAFRPLLANINTPADLAALIGEV